MTDLRKAAEMALEALEKDPVLLNAINNAKCFLFFALAQSEQEPEHVLDIYERAYFAGKQDGIDETIALLKVKNK